MSRPRSHPRLASGLPLLALGLALAPAPASAAKVQMAWDPNPETDVAGYRVYYDTNSGPPYGECNTAAAPIVAAEGPSFVDVPMASLPDPAAPVVLLTGLPSCAHLYFAATAYDTSGNESDYSGEVDVTLRTRPAWVKASASGSGSVTVTWAPLPDGDPGAAWAYRIHYDTDSGEPYAGTGAAQGSSPVEVLASSLSAAAPSYTLTGLTTGQTIYVAVEIVCPDGASSLTTVEAMGTVGPCSCASQCDDADPCTDDTCSSGACAHAARSCDDSDPCTTDTCTASGCDHAAMDCDDGNACTRDWCTASGCQHPPLQCAGTDKCLVNLCSASLGCDNAARACDDLDPCTVDACASSTGCTSTPMTCDDGDGCTSDSCSAGACLFEPIAGCVPADAGEPGPDAATPPGPDASAPEPDAATPPGPDASQPEADAAAQPGPDAQLAEADAASIPESDASAARPDASSPADGGEAPSDAALPSVDEEVTAGCGCAAATGAPSGALLLALALGLRRRRLP